MEKLVLNIEQITVIAENKTLFKDFSLSLKSGEIKGLYAPTGSGKSTLLNIAAGFSFEKEINFQGNINRIENCNTGYVFQNPVLLENQTVEKNILVSMNAAKKQDKNISLLCSKILEKMDLADKAKTPVKKLSGGEKQRVCIARSIAEKKDLLLLDEPFSNQDAAHTQKIMEIIKNYVVENHTAVLFVSHNLEQIKQLCSSYITVEQFVNVKTEFVKNE